MLSRTTNAARSDQPQQPERLLTVRALLEHRPAPRRKVSSNFNGSAAAGDVAILRVHQARSARDGPRDTFVA